jgi:hypothetical protein
LKLFNHGYSYFKDYFLIRRGSLKKILFKCVILAAVFMVVVGCSNPGASTVNGNAKSKTTSTSKENGKVSTTEKENEKTIQTFLKVELTGPNEEYKKAFDLISNGGPNFALKSAYDKKYYKPLLSEHYYQEFTNELNEEYFLEAAYMEGYQFKVKTIKIKKEKDYYSWAADVDYTKNGKTKTSTVNGWVTLNEGKIIYVRFFKGNDGIWKIEREAIQQMKKTS